MGDLDLMDGALMGVAGVIVLGAIVIPALAVAIVGSVGWLIYRAVTAASGFVQSRRPSPEVGYMVDGRAEAVCDIVAMHRQALAEMDRIAREHVIEGHGREVQR
jgi:hypothetical protein